MSSMNYNVRPFVSRFFLQKCLQKYNHLQPPDAADFHHGGHNS